MPCLEEVFALFLLFPPILNSMMDYFLFTASHYIKHIYLLINYIFQHSEANDFGL